MSQAQPFNNQELMQGLTQQQWAYFVLAIGLLRDRDEQTCMDRWDMHVTRAMWGAECDMNNN